METLQQQCERLVFFMATNVPTKDSSGTVNEQVNYCSPNSIPNKKIDYLKMCNYQLIECL